MTDSLPDKATRPPRVSVIVPAHNAERYLRETLESVRAQTLRELEVIVVDDGSTDATAAIVAATAAEDPRVRYIHQSNQEKAVARNTGIAAARGEFVAFIDADDLWLREKLERQLHALEAGADVVYCAFTAVDAAGNPRALTWQRPATWGTLREDLCYFNVIEASASSVMARRTCFERAGLFDPSLAKFGEDVDMWRRLAHAGFRIVRIDEPLVRVREHEASASRGPADDGSQYVHAERLVAKIEHDLPPDLREHEKPLRYRWNLTLLNLALAHHDRGRALRYARRIAALGPTYWYGLVLDTLTTRSRLLAKILPRPRFREPRQWPWRIVDAG